MEYSKAIKDKMVRKMLPPTSRSAGAVELETGIPQPTLSRWLREARGVAGGMSQDRKKWTAGEKLRAVIKAGGLTDDKLGEFLRTEGLHEAQLQQWRADAEAALADLPRRRQRSAEAQRIKQLERELRRKDKALAEVSAILVLKKKAAEIWGDEDDGTPGRNEP